MSSLIVEVCRIENLSTHPNAEKLELAHVKGWQVCVPKGRYSAGDSVVYIPIDSVLPVALSDRLGITKYLSNGRVRCARLRGEPSFGVVMDVEGGLVIGTDVAESYGITKYIPPLKTSVGDAEPDHPLFVSYTEIENLRNFPESFTPNEPVIATEKIHGTNCRVGLIEGEPMAGSKSVRRKRPADTALAADLYWHPWSLPAVAQMLTDQGKDHRQVILFGETYGKVQSLRYGVEKGIAFAAFDLMLDGRYLAAPAFGDLCGQYRILTVPIAYRGPFDITHIKTATEGKSLMPGANHIREGVVVRPVEERLDPKVGRLILKYLSDDYLLGNESDTDDQ